MIRVCGLDLSLERTGYAAVADNGYTSVGTVAAGGRRGVSRLIHIRDRITDIIRGVNFWDLILIEDLPHGARNNAAGPLGELHGVIKVALYEEGISYVLVPPATLKKYATGRGNADKIAVVTAAVRRASYGGEDSNEADALWLAHIGLDHLGTPRVTVPAAHRTALDNVVWP